MKPPWPVCQGGISYRRLSWVRTSTSGTASPTDYPAQKAGEIGHPAKGPTRTVCVCVCVCLCVCFPEQPTEILASRCTTGEELKSPRNWAALLKYLVCGEACMNSCFSLVLWGFFPPLSLNTSKSLPRNTKTELCLPLLMVIKAGELLEHLQTLSLHSESACPRTLT